MSILEPDFDFKNPNYNSIYRKRIARLTKIRSSKDKMFLPALHKFYSKNIAHFINDWGCTYDPRNLDKNLPVSIPFILFDKQIEFVNEVISSFYAQQPLIVEKSRDMGVTWLCVAIFCSLALFNEDAVFGFGSRKSEYVDKLGDMGSILEKARFFLENLPIEFRGGFLRKVNSKENLLIIPATCARIKGEAGDQIGRGDRTTGHCIDESAHIERAQLIEASLSQTTNFRLDVSTPFGMGNVFAQKRHSGKYNVFTFHWRDDPRKDEKWYQKQIEILDPVTVAQEIDLDYTGSVEGVIIPAAWVQAAVDAHIKLGIEKSGERISALDLADEGADLNALCMRQGVVLENAYDWSGKGSDIFETVRTAVSDCERYRCDTCFYDAEGLGTGVRGDAKQVQREMGSSIIFKPFSGGGAVYKPELRIDGKIKNKDAFANRKAHAWWQLRFRFQNTYRWINDGIVCDPDSIISISSETKNLHKLKLELSQPTYTKNSSGKIVVNKKPDGARSPNLADAVMMAFQNDYTVIQIHQNSMRVLCN